MTKRIPMCTIKGCNHRGKRKVKIDIGPTLGDAVVQSSARIQVIRVCDEHLEIMRGARDLEGLSIGDNKHGIDGSPIRGSGGSG